MQARTTFSKIQCPRCGEDNQLQVVRKKDTIFRCPTPFCRIRFHANGETVTERRRRENASQN